MKLVRTGLLLGASLVFAVVAQADSPREPKVLEGKQNHHIKSHHHVPKGHPAPLSRDDKDALIAKIRGHKGSAPTPPTTAPGGPATINQTMGNLYVPNVFAAAIDSPSVIVADGAYLSGTTAGPDADNAPAYWVGVYGTGKWSVDCEVQDQSGALPDAYSVFFQDGYFTNEVSDSTEIITASNGHITFGVTATQPSWGMRITRAVPWVWTGCKIDPVT
jgi:hypothetical protein